MGLCGSSLPADEKEARKADRAIMEEQKRQQKEDEMKIKLLLLGAGESGKSTIFKQIKKIYGDGFTPDEQQLFTNVIYSNIIFCMQNVCKALPQLGVEGGGSLLEELAQKDAYDWVLNAAKDTDINEAEMKMLLPLWQDPAIQKAWARKSEFQVYDCLEFFMGKINDIAQFNYLASPDDIFHARVITSGIIEDRYLIEHTPFIMYDVGGQRNERKKWIHCFSEVTAVIFVASLSEYDQRLFEDDETNRMTEAINLFDEICNSRWFVNTSMILFLNKKDLFKEKIKQVSISSVETFADDYKGEDNNYDEGIQFFLNQFLKRNMQNNKEVFWHVTCAIDTNNVRVVFNACREIIMKKNLTGSGFME